MELITFAIYDSKADAHPSQFMAPNVAMGCRIFQASVVDDNTQFAKHPGDYILMQTGTWDSVTAINTDISPHIDLGTARMWRSRYLLEQDHAQPPTNTDIEAATCRECGFLEGHDEECPAHFETLPKATAAQTAREVADHFDQRQLNSEESIRALNMAADILEAETS